MPKHSAQHTRATGSAVRYTRPFASYTTPDPPKSFSIGDRHADERPSCGTRDMVAHSSPPATHPGGVDAPPEHYHTYGELEPESVHFSGDI